MIRPLLFGFLLLAACGKPEKPAIQVSDAWARATAAGQSSGAVYATISNEGGSADRLIVASSERAADATLHEGSMENGIARMRMVGGIDLEPGERVEMKPGGTHVMLTSLKSPLKAGEQFQLVLRFQQSGEMTVPVTVVAPGAR